MTDLRPALALPPLDPTAAPFPGAIPPSSPCVRARGVHAGVRQPASPASVEQMLGALKACYADRSCCSPGQTAALALALELVLTTAPGRYGARPALLPDHLRNLRRLIGDTLHHHACSLDWRAPSSAVTAWRLSAAYLSDFVGRTEEMRSGRTFESTWTRQRIADGIVRRSKYRVADEADLWWALRTAEQHLAAEPALVRQAADVYAQAALFLLPQVPDLPVPDSLWELRPDTDRENAWLALRLAHLALAMNARQELQDRASLQIDAVLEGEPSPARSIAGLLKAYQTTRLALPEETPSLVGLRHPFDFPRHLGEQCRPEAVAGVARRFEDAVASLGDVATGVLVRQLRCRLLDVVARAETEDGEHARAAEACRRALEVNPSSDSVDEALRIANRHLELARLAQDRDALAAGLRMLDLQVLRRQHSAQPHLTLARHIERGGLPPGDDLPCEVEGPHDCAVALFRVGDSRASYAVAGRRTLQSATMHRLQLGGRAGAEMPLSLASDEPHSVVIKPTTRTNLDRELALHERIRSHAPVDAEWRLANFVAAHPVTPPPGTKVDTAAIWQWTEGVVASSFLAEHPGETAALLPRVAGALGELHRTLEPDLVNREHCFPVKGRLHHKDKFLGMWLRGLLAEAGGAGAPIELFDAWLDGVHGTGMPWTPRTDAHLENWIVEPRDHGLVRLDLEATGWSPFGFELAQVTDDFPLLGWDGDGKAARLACLRAYSAGIGAPQLADDPEAWAAYLWSVAGRAVRPLRSGTNRDKYEAALTSLRVLAEEGDSPPALRRFCTAVLEAWQDRAPEAALHIDERQVELFEPQELRRASKRLAYLLRHDQALPRDRYGFADLDVVLDHFQEHKDYARLPREILEHYVRTIVLRLDEARFELKDDRLRAKYGQSVEVEYAAPNVLPARPRLFHGTTWEAVEAIVAATSAGLEPRSRSWVHMSTEVSEAARVGTRRGWPLILELPEAADLAGEAVQAGPVTWVVRRVPKELLRVVPVHELVVDGSDLPALS